MQVYQKISEALEKSEGQNVKIRGWIYRTRSSGKLAFVTLRDSNGTIQVIAEKEKLPEEDFQAAQKALVESSVEIEGKIHEDKRAPGGKEIHATSFHVIQFAEDFPITKDQSTEFLLDNRHLWIRSRKLTTVMKIRSTLVGAIHEFFRSHGFYEFHPPILQPSQCEGGSTLFEVNFYGGKTYLSQSWQLYAEAAIFALEKVYDVAPTFRAERSKTSRHLSEFWMAEMEVAWFDLEKVTEFAKEEVKFIIKKIIEEHGENLSFLGRNPDTLRSIIAKPWPTIKYREALAILNEHGMNVPFGKDLRTIEEQELMKHFETPVVITHYPKEAMAFYKPRDPQHPDEALCFDMLALEGYGEIVGGSQRSTDINELIESLEKQGEDARNYEWYLDLRRYGSVSHSGYGLGIERLLAWICKLDNIKDTIPFPRTINRKYP
ncbi:MAG: asparagine--tRNA ligase [Candidatus Thermoplasmatota archaeon]|nr:asparagine--tRNA ligase [Candidatus Thermoplasmatota archaeon]